MPFFIRIRLFRIMLSLTTASFLITLAVWVKARDPFVRMYFSVPVASCQAVSCIAVMPRHMRELPVVLYLHSSPAELIDCGNDLRLLSELGIVAVGVQYSATDQAEFASQMNAVNKWVRGCKSANPNKVAWMGSYDTAQTMLDCLWKHPEMQPNLAVALSVGKIPNISQKAPHLQCRILLVQGEFDEMCSLEDCMRGVEKLRLKASSVELRLLNRQRHDLGVEKPLITHGIGEYCAQFFRSEQRLHTNVQNQLWFYWIPSTILVCASMIVFFCQLVSTARGSPFPRVIAFVASGAILMLAFISGGMWLGSSGANAFILKRKLSSLNDPTVSADLEWGQAHGYFQNESRSSIADTLLLAHLQRQKFYQNLSNETYRNFLLSPLIHSDLEQDTKWRRPLWEAFNLRIRHESDAYFAAQMVVRLLRERVSVVQERQRQKSVTSIWRDGVTDPTGFETIYVACLRSVGIASRLDSEQFTELWNGVAWIKAPRPLFLLF